MVLLTMTQSIVDCLARIDYQAMNPDESSDPSLVNPAIGNPILHSQILRLSKSQKAFRLEELLRGSQIYVTPPAPKPAKSPEYIALMAKLRRDEDARAYQRMINPPIPLETFKDRFPNSARSFAAANKPTSDADIGDDDVTYNEIHRQVMLLINFLVSIAGVAATLWILGRWWSLPARLLLTMAGSILVAIAEVAVYGGYVWRMGEAKRKEDIRPERKEVVQTWILLPAILTPRRTKPGVRPLSRKRDKPLRTYGKRSTATPEPRSEPPAKRARTACTVLDDKNIKPLGFIVHEDYVPTNLSVFKAKPQPTAEQGQGKQPLSKPELNPPAKRSILNYFRPTTHLIPIEPTKANTLPGAGCVEEKTDRPVAQPKSRLLRIRLNQSIHRDDETGQERDHSRMSEKDEPKDVMKGIPQPRSKRRLGGGGGSAGSGCRRVRRKPSSTEVQTTLNISSKAAFSECTICDTVWNPLYPDDVKYHTKRHAAHLKMKKKREDDF
ncbi:ATPase, vacuolar ER assembly factor, Vma12 [Beauveria bassiana ARSEF 2860]|uniref:ATPase, vacuolar ER assembly factor, Vma12 n=1 Tax=Beauveria bassiana (strain ARSEF 2860) TaxID=655819 RepID=J4UG81_BEAB2|nr:ATPase, vacuolar ER assembly factor, Vma12 [Beauveria bassiana ARSEF 2860]EJP61757.1 ATPase, vacuolar ER assembly factor, Vma12 [Beauveria bassiana ARSEF 2860]